MYISVILHVHCFLAIPGGYMYDTHCVVVITKVMKNATKLCTTTLTPVAK